MLGLSTEHFNAFSNNNTEERILYSIYHMKKLLLREKSYDFDVRNVVMDAITSGLSILIYTLSATVLFLYYTIIDHKLYRNEHPNKPSFVMTPKKYP